MNEKELNEILLSSLTSRKECVALRRQIRFHMNENFPLPDWEELPDWACPACGAQKGISSPNGFDLECNACEFVWDWYDVHHPSIVAKIMRGQPK